MLARSALRMAKANSGVFPGRLVLVVRLVFGIIVV
jgi:hypothetical protein